MGPRSSALLLAILAGAVTSVAHADDRAAAQQLFLEGKELMRAGTFEQACQKFEAASQLSSTPGVRLNLADCLEKLGHTASAWARFDEALSMAERNGDGAAAELARKGRARLEPQLAYLTIVVPPAAVVAGLEVKRDGETLPKAAWGTGIPVDPGDHEVSAEAPNRARWSKKTAVVGSGAKVTVEVPPLAPAMERPPEIAVVPAPDRRGPAQRTAGWITGGAGVIGLGLGIGFAVEALIQRGDYHSHLNPSGQCADATCQTDSHAAYTDGNIATAGFIVGGAAAAAGALLLFTAPSRPRTSPPPNAGFVPIITPHMGGVGMIGSW